MKTYTLIFDSNNSDSKRNLHDFLMSERGITVNPQNSLNNLYIIDASEFSMRLLCTRLINFISSTNDRITINQNITTNGRSSQIFFDVIFYNQIRLEVNVPHSNTPDDLILVSDATSARVVASNPCSLSTSQIPVNGNQIHALRILLNELGRMYSCPIQMPPKMRVYYRNESNSIGNLIAQFANDRTCRVYSSDAAAIDDVYNPTKNVVAAMDESLNRHQIGASSIGKIEFDLNENLAGQPAETTVHVKLGKYTNPSLAFKHISEKLPKINAFPVDERNKIYSGVEVENMMTSLWRVLVQDCALTEQDQFWLLRE
jgi:hypothetical protein